MTGHGFGTSPVFFTAISTILGAVLFWRFGYAMAHTGLAGVILLILIGHAITIPTALAIAEIATNLKVEGGGEYFMISRSFGSMVGGTIGISLYLSQAISVAFYMIAFTEAFKPLFIPLQEMLGFTPHAMMISIPATIGLIILIIYKGANIGDIIDGCHFTAIADYNICVLRSSDRHFGYRKRIHIWLTPGDYRNANLVILLAYIIMGHPEWKDCNIELFGAFEVKELNRKVGKLDKLINNGRIPISEKNIQKIPWNKKAKTYETFVCEHSAKLI